MKHARIVQAEPILQLQALQDVPIAPVAHILHGAQPAVSIARQEPTLQAAILTAPTVQPESSLEPLHQHA